MIAPRSGARDAEAAVLLAFEPRNTKLSLTTLQCPSRSVLVDAGSLGPEDVPHTTSFVTTPLVLPVPS